MDLWKLAEEIGVPAVATLSTWMAQLRRVRARLEMMERELKALRKGWRLEIDARNEEVAKRLDEAETLAKTALDEIRRFRDSSNDFAKDAELSQYMADQQERWEHVHRSLGQIEGMLRTRISTPPRSGR